MKFELNDEAASAAITLIVAITIITIAFLIYRYNAMAFEQGYSQQLIEGTQQLGWVKSQ